MAMNPYAPPGTAVADVPAVDTAAPWFAVSVSKLFVMCIFTLMLYQIYWFYRQWSHVKRREALSIWPVPRAIFAVFFCYQLYARIRDDGKPLRVADLAAGPLAAGYIVTTLLSPLPDPYWLVVFASNFFLLPVQAAANAVNAAKAPQHDANAKYSVLNCVGIGIGGAMLALTLIGIFFPG